MKTLILGLIISCVGAWAQAQAGAERIVDQFFHTYEQEGIGEAIEYIFSTNPWMSKKPDAVVKLRNQAENYLTDDVVGKYYGQELIGKKSLGESFVMFSYLVKYDRQPFRFNFLLYNPEMPKDRWQLQNFSFDDNLDDELDEALKIENLPQEP